MTEADTEDDTEAEAMMREKAEGIERTRAEEESKSRAEDDMLKQVWRANSLGAETRGVKPETKIAVSEAQARAKAETDIESIVNRKRAAAKDKTKANSYIIEISDG